LSQSAEDFRTKAPCNSKLTIGQQPSVVFILGASLIERIWHGVSKKKRGINPRRE
jgi:hypothetical protein